MTTLNGQFPYVCRKCSKLIRFQDPCYFVNGQGIDKDIVLCDDCGKKNQLYYGED